MGYGTGRRAGQMTHALAIVLVEPGRDVASEVERLLAPFSENSEAAAAQYDDEGNERPGYAPGQFWWDWYRVGGRWDGTVRGLEYESAPGCRCAPDGLMDAASSDCHYGERHTTLERNVIPVREMGEVRPFRLVTPEGETRSREHWVSDPTAFSTAWPWDLTDDEGYDRWCGEQLLAHRDCLAVGVDYHN